VHSGESTVDPRRRPILGKAPIAWNPPNDNGSSGNREKVVQSPQSSVLSAAIQLPAIQQLLAVPQLSAIPELPAITQLLAITSQLPAVPHLLATPQVFSAAVAGLQSSYALPIHTLHIPRRQAVQKKQTRSRRQPIPAAPWWMPPAAATPSRAKRVRTTEFQLEVLAWA
jgi:hypothetical protein